MEERRFRHLATPDLVGTLYHNNYTDGLCTSSVIKSTNIGDALSASIVMIFGIVVFARSRQFPSEAAGTPGAGLYPAFIAVSLFVLGLILLMQSYILSGSKKDTPPLSSAAIKKLIVPTLALLGYILLLSVAGFLLSTVVFLVALMRYSGVNKYQRSAPISITVAIVLQYVFSGFLNVPIPEGIIPVSRLLPSLQVGVMI